MHRPIGGYLVSDIAVFVLKRDVKLQLLAAIGLLAPLSLLLAAADSRR